MKRILSVLIISLIPVSLLAQRERAVNLLPLPLVQGFSITAAGATMRMDADGEMLACKFYADRTTAITGIDWNLVVGGTVTDTNFTVEVNADSSDTPSGTPLGAASAEFAGPAATGYVGLQTFTSTGALTLNAAYWAVIKRTSGGSLSGTDFLELRRQNITYNREKLRHHNGTNWTTDSAVNNACLITFQHADSSYSGTPITANSSASSATNIGSSSAVQGVRFKYGSQIKVLGARFSLTKTSSPGAARFTVYEGDTSKYNDSLAAAELATNDTSIVWFTSPVLLAPDTNLYIIIDCPSGCDGSNNYDLRTNACTGTYIGSLLPTDLRFVSGTAGNPSTLSVSTTECPTLSPIIEDPAADFDFSSSGRRSIIGS